MDKEKVRNAIKDCLRHIFIVMAMAAHDEEDRVTERYNEYKEILVDELARADEKYKNVSKTEILVMAMFDLATRLPEEQLDKMLEEIKEN